MKNRYVILFTLLISFSVNTLFSQSEPSLMNGEIDVRINQALDLFSSGEYDRAIAILENILILNPANQRALDLKKSIEELHEMEMSSTEDSDQPYNTERPDFSLSETEESEDQDEVLEKPDFSVREEENEILYPADTRTFLELSLSPNLVMPWDMGEESIVFPSKSDFSGSFNVKADFFFNRWDRIFGLSSAYSLFLLNPSEGSFASQRLNVFDAMISFRTFFSETIDSKIVFKLAIGYRGYFSNGYDFYAVDRSFLNGFNMGINLEAPLLYLFFDNEFLKRIIFDIDMNLLFFPELNTLNLFDFKIKSELRFSHFSAGIHFGAYSVITPEQVDYMWMTGLNLKLFF